MEIKFDNMEIKYNNTNDFDNEEIRKEISTVMCKCKNNTFLVNHIVSPYTGGYFKLTCSKCNSSEVLLDDYSYPIEL